MSAAEPLAVYIHWPFCRSKCPYCDFNSHVRERVDAARWQQALLADLDHHAERVPGREVGSVFFGGGTPSLMSPETVATLLERVRACWTVTPDIEVTLEANPNSAEAARFRAFAAAGVNRLSLGVQALDPAALRMLGRAHDRSEAIAAIEHARASFARFSFDLIYARPGQSLAAWRRELDEALMLAGDHLSVYQLTIEPGTAFATMQRRGELVVPAEEEAAALFETTQDRLAARGLPAYEISNHARPGAECRHNLAYWRYQDYVGIGPGAHGRLTMGDVKYATRQARLSCRVFHVAHGQPPVRPRPDPDIVLIAPIGEVVPALGPRPGVIGDLVGRQAPRGEPVLCRLEQCCRLLLCGHDELAASLHRGKGSAGFDRQLVDGEVISGEHQRLVELSPPGGKALARPGIDQIEREPRKAGAGMLDRGDRLAAVMSPA